MAPQQRPIFHVYCDESHIRPKEYRVQGGIWVPEHAMRAVRAEMTELRKRHPRFGEFKWKRNSGSKLMTAYCQLVDIFFNSAVADSLRFNCMVIRNSDDRGDRDGAAGRDASFYKSYYLLLHHRMAPDAVHHVRLDHRSSVEKDPERTLMECVNSAGWKLGAHDTRVMSCRSQDSKDEDLLQLADVLCGCVGWAWNGRDTSSAAKSGLESHICAYLGWPTLHMRSTHAKAPKFNVWKYTKQAGETLPLVGGRVR